jgi:hypothetical protein
MVGFPQYSPFAGKRRREAVVSFRKERFLSIFIIRNLQFYTLIIEANEFVDIIKGNEHSDGIANHGWIDDQRQSIKDFLRNIVVGEQGSEKEEEYHGPLQNNEQENRRGE